MTREHPTKLLSIGEAAAKMGIHVHTLRRWVANGSIRAVRLPSGYRRFEPAEIERKMREMGFTDPQVAGGKGGSELSSEAGGEGTENS
jgi:excisionase family DNA binding protein